MSEEQSENIEEEEVPLKVEITNHPIKEEIKNPTSEDTPDEYSVLVTEEEIKEMQDAQ